MPRIALLLMLIGLLTACIEPVVPPPTVPDDDDATADDDDDDDDSSVGDDDDTTADDDDDDDTTEPPSTTVTIEADAPPGTVLLSQDGAGPWTPVTVTDLQGSFEVSDPDGHYGVVLACEGPVGATLRVHFSDASSEPNVVLGCPEGAARDGAVGGLSGTVVGAEGAWRLYVGSRAWSAAQTSVTSYGIYPFVDNYDLIAQRLDSQGVVNKQLISRAMNAGANPGFSVDFWDDGSGYPHTPESYQLEVTVPQGTSIATRAMWLSRGGTVMHLGFEEGVEPSFFVISNERRFDTEVVLTDTTSTYQSGCVTRTMAIVDSELMLDNAARHSATVMPMEPLADSVCDDALAPTISVDSGLSVNWSAALSGSAPTDGVRIELSSPNGRPRWFVTASNSRLDHDVDVAEVLGLAGAGYGTPASGWTWTSSAWALPGVDVPISVPFLVMDNRMFQGVPQGRSRFRFARPGDIGDEERNHEYEDDDLTRPVIVLPWDMDNWAVRAVTRSGDL